MTIASADLLPILDSLGIMANDLDALPATTQGAEIITGAAHVATDVLALTDISVVKDLATGADALNISANAAPGGTGAYLSKTALFSSMLAAIQRHTTSLNTYLTNNSAKVSRSFANLWRSIYSTTSLSAANVFQDTNVVARTGAITGATTVTNTAGTELDPALVAPSQYELHCTVDIAGSSTPTVSLTMKKADGSTEVKTKALDDTFDAGENLDIGTGSDVYIGCNLITVTGGGASGTFQVRNKLTRTPVI